MKPIPYGKQDITDEDILEVTNCLRSDFLTQGPKINEFEEKFASYIGAKYAVAVANGTAALHLAALALDVKPGDKVITTPITFAASANCIRYCDGEITFADIDPDTFLIDLEKVKQLLEAAPRGTYKGIVPVDFAGRAVNMEALRRIADEYNLWIIEDACHAPGAYFTDSDNVIQMSGNGKFAELAVFSFHPVKHIACGEGGMITTNDQELYKRLLKLRTHGITKDAAAFTNSIAFAAGTDTVQSGYPNWYMEMQDLGFNYRITDFQAALGVSQLKRADAGLARRKEIARTYDLAFKEHPHIKSPLLELNENSSEGHAYHLYVIQTDKRLELYNFLRTQKIYCQVHYIPAHLMPYYRQFGWSEGDMPQAEAYYRQCVSLPMYPTLLPEEQQYVINKINEFFGITGI